MDKDKPHIPLDVCGLAPPEPLERVLDALSGLGRGYRLRVLIDREPLPLYGILDKNNFLYQATVLSDYRHEILIWHRPS